MLREDLPENYPLRQGFGEGGKGYFRFSAFGSSEETKEAAKRLYNLLKK